jgi:hypothetical protein
MEVYDITEVDVVVQNLCKILIEIHNLLIFLCLLTYVQDKGSILSVFLPMGVTFLRPKCCHKGSGKLQI